MNEQRITFVGNLTAAPELRFTPSGKAVANFTIASTPRRFDRQSGEWRDGDPVFMRGTVWGEQAEQVANSLDVGVRVVAVGNLREHRWEDRETGAKRSRLELDVDELAASLKFAQVKVSKIERQRGEDRGGNGSTGEANPFDDEPPF